MTGGTSKSFPVAGSRLDIVNSSSSGTSTKSSVRGADANPLFRQLAQISGTTPKWNFYKYLIARDGTVVDSYSSLTTPEDRGFVRDLEKQLAVH